MLKYFVSYIHNKGPGWATINRSHPVQDNKDLEMIVRSLLKNGQEEDSSIEWISLVNIQRMPI